MALATLDQQGCSWQLPGNMNLRGDSAPIMHWLKSWLVVLKLLLLVKLWEALSSAGRCSLPQQSMWHQLLEGTRMLFFILMCGRRAHCTIVVQSCR